MQPPRGQTGEADQHRFPAGSAQREMVGRTEKLAAELVRDHQPLVLGQNMVRKIRGDGKGKKIAEVVIVVPFVIGLKVEQAGFDFDDGDPAEMIQADDVGAPAIGERHFEQHRLIGGHQRSPDAASQTRRDVGTGGCDVVRLCHRRHRSPHDPQPVDVFPVTPARRL